MLNPFCNLIYDLLSVLFPPPFLTVKLLIILKFSHVMSRCGLFMQLTCQIILFYGKNFIHLYSLPNFFLRMFMSYFFAKKFWRLTNIVLYLTKIVIRFSAWRPVCVFEIKSDVNRLFIVSAGAYKTLFGIQMKCGCTLVRYENIILRLSGSRFKVPGWKNSDSSYQRDRGVIW